MIAAKGSKRVVLLVCAALLSSALAMAQAGSLDPTFGSGGIVTTPGAQCGGGAPAINCVLAIQSNGKIVVAGSNVPPPENTAITLARYNTDGSLDSTFGNAGIVAFNTDNGGPPFGLAIQSDGKIVFAAPNNIVLNVFRLNSNGTLDTTFGTGGIASVSTFLVGATPGGMALSPNGKILVAVAGSLVQLLPNGQLDSSFGTGGVAPLLQTAGALAFSGQPLVLSNFGSASATQYSSNGSLNTAFGVNGQAPSLGFPGAIVLLGKGNFGSSKFIVAGALPIAAVPPGGNTPQAFILVRYNGNGTIDTTFGTNGAEVTTFPGENYSAVLALAVQSNGDILAAGVTKNQSGGSPSDFALARYTANGPLDTTFGNNGLVTTGFGTNGDNLASASALAIQSDGKIIAGGSNVSPNGVSDGFTLARYLSH